MFVITGIGKLFLFFTYHDNHIIHGSRILFFLDYGSQKINLGRSLFHAKPPTNKDDGAEPGGHQVNARVIFVTGDDHKNHPHGETLLVLDNGDGSYTFSYCPKSTGRLELSVMVEGQEVRGSPFTWEVYPALPSASDSNRGVRIVTAGRARGSARVEDDTSGFKEGRYCWKLQLVALSADAICLLKVGVNSSPQRYPSGVYGAPRDSRNPGKWSWSYDTKDQKSSRSDRQKPSITSVKEKDVFTVFLSFETEKLIIFNQRSKQTEIFNGVQGYGLFPMNTCEYSFGRIVGQVYPSFNVLIE